MDIECRYVDSRTGTVLGYLYSNKTYKLAVSFEKARELDLDSSFALPYLDLESILVREYNGKYYDEATCIFEEDNSEYLEDKEDNLRCRVGGMWFNKYQCIEIDNSVAIERFLYEK